MTWGGNEGEEKGFNFKEEIPCPFFRRLESWKGGGGIWI
jgi:hypothetical protein